MWNGLSVHVAHRSMIGAKISLPLSKSPMTTFKPQYGATNWELTISTDWQITIVGGSHSSESTIRRVLIATPGALRSYVFPQAVVPVGLVPEQKNVAGPVWTGHDACLLKIEPLAVKAA
jgi:hypothetical protein